MSLRSYIPDYAGRYQQKRTEHSFVCGQRGVEQRAVNALAAATVISAELAEIEIAEKRRQSTNPDKKEYLEKRLAGVKETGAFRSLRRR